MLPSRLVSRLRCAGALSIVCLLTVGCGGSADKKIAVSGSASFDGEPIENGEIEFKPTESGGRPAVGTIVGGKYRISEQFGAKPGNYSVSITARRQTEVQGPGNPYATDAVATEQYIPPKYNANTTLQVDISAASAVHDFQLVSKD